MTYGDTVWVGTANGINRGILDDSGCLDWKHYSFPVSSMSGNWVIAIEKQEWKGQRTIWAVTRAADQAGEENGISFTQNDGETWQTVSLLKGEYGYNIFAVDSLVYIATRNGLWRTQDGQSFALYRPAIDKARSDEIIDNDVYAVLHDKRPFYDDALWIGTGDGLARSHTPSSNESIWQIYRSNVSSNTPYAYPNPFSPTLHNQLDGDGYVRFDYKVKKSNLIKLIVLSFAMEEVRAIDFTRGEGQGALKWDGRDEAGNLVANGTYFCNLFYDDTSHWVKVVVVK
jgi:ligand-binding sensor domain-containing protein